jgi:hypothetical protein
MTNASPRAPENKSHQLRSLAWIMVVFNLVVIGLAAWTLSNSRRQYVERAELTTHNLALVLEQNLMANVHQIDLVLQSVQDEAERMDVATGTLGIETHVQAQFARIPLLDSLRTTDAEGRLEQLGESDPQAHADFSARPYFQYLRRTPQAGLFISHPSRDGAKNAWVITLARRMERPAGVFRGVVFATVRLDQLTRELAQVDVGRWGSISLRGGDLELLARYPGFPEQDKLIGDEHISGDYLVAVQSGRQVSHFTTASVIDGQVRTYTFRRLSNPTFYVLVSLAEAEYLQTWHREALLSSAAVLGLLTLSLGIAWLARLAWGRQMTSQAERERLIQELTLALAEVKNLSGMLPICGQCKKIRDDQGYWNNLESYIAEHSEATFTHGVCPECAKEMRREMQARRDQR